MRKRNGNDGLDRIEIIEKTTMYVTKSLIKLHLNDEPGSLKEKRRVIKSLKERVQNKFKVSIAEVGDNNLWQNAQLGISFVCVDGARAERILSSILGFIEANYTVEIIENYTETEKIKKAP